MWLLIGGEGGKGYDCFDRVEFVVDRWGRVSKVVDLIDF